MTTTARIGHGTTFKLDNASNVLTLCGMITSVNGPNRKRDTIDVTDMDSTSRYREFIAGLRDGGEFTLELNYDPQSTTDVLLQSAYDSDATRSFEIAWPDGAKAAGESFVTDIGVATPLADKMTQSVTLKITGVTTYTSS